MANNMPPWNLRRRVEPEPEPPQDPLFLAIRANNVAEVQKLLAAGADANQVDADVSNILFDFKRRITDQTVYRQGRNWQEQAEARRLAFEAALTPEMREEQARRAGFAARLDDRLSARTPLTLAVSLGHTDIVNLLLERGANPELATIDKYDRETRPIEIAVEKGDVNMVRVLLERGASPEGLCRKDGIHTLLTFAILHDNIGMAELLLAQGADVNARNPEYPDKFKTALMVATENHKAYGVQLLLDSGADLNLQDSNGETALMKAVYEKIGIYEPWPLREGFPRAGQESLSIGGKPNAAIASLLLEKGANVNLHNNKGMTALDLSLTEDILRELIAAGADVARTVEGVGRLSPLLLFNPRGSDQTLETRRIVQRKLELLDATAFERMRAAAEPLVADNEARWQVALNAEEERRRQREEARMPAWARAFKLLDNAPHRGYLTIPTPAEHNINLLTRGVREEGDEVVRLTIDGTAYLYNKDYLQAAWNAANRIPFNPSTDLPLKETDVAERFTIHIQDEIPEMKVPRNAQNAINFVPLQDNNNLLNFHGEAALANPRFYKKSTIDRLPLPKLNPFTRAPIVDVKQYKVSSNRTGGGRRTRRVLRKKTRRFGAARTRKV